MLHDVAKEDPHLKKKRYELMLAKARQLVNARMILYDEDNGTLASAELGRIAAKYYVKSASVEKYNGLFRHGMEEAEVFAMFSESAEVSERRLGAIKVYTSCMLSV